MPATRPVAVDLDVEVHARVRELAKARNRPAHSLMREAIGEYVDREEKRETFRRETLAAWAAYEASGRHLTGSEAEAWLARLEAGHDVEPPECHD